VESEVEFQGVEKRDAIIYQFPVSNLAERQSATDEAGATLEAGQQGHPSAKEMPRDFLRVGRKVLTEQDLATPAARRFMIAEIERLDADCDDLKKIAQHYHDLRADFAAIRESHNSSKLIDVLSAVLLAVGSAGLGAAPGYLSVHGAESIGWTFVIGSALLVAGAVGIIAAQVLRR
jgi:hypothetical protein